MAFLHDIVLSHVDLEGLGVGTRRLIPALVGTLVVGLAVETELGQSVVLVGTHVHLRAREKVWRPGICSW